MRVETLDTRQVRRLALAARAGLLAPSRVGLPARAAGSGRRARRGAHAVIDHFGYLQLDTVSVAGARTQSIVLASRLEGFEAHTAERLLQPGEPLFEYWGHEASWMPLALYPHFAFRRRDYRVHPWRGNLLGEHRALADRVLDRIARDGPLRSVDLEGGGSGGGDGWWNWKLSKRVAEALWFAGELAIRERRNFQRSFDLPERVIPAEYRTARMSDEAAIEALLLRALDGHGFASTATLSATWRFRRRAGDVRGALARLAERGEIVAARAELAGRTVEGWIRPRDLELLPALEALRPRRGRGVLLSPFDPVLWDRGRVARIFGFDLRIEIYTPAPERRFGYYCLPVLAGERLVGRVDLKADRAGGGLAVLSRHYERARRSGAPHARDVAAVDSALARYAGAVGLALVE